MSQTADHKHTQPEKSKRYQSVLSFFAHTVYFIFICAVVSFAGLYLRLLWKPIDLDFIQPYIEKQIIDNHISNINFKHPQLALSEYASHKIVLKFDEISIATHQNQYQHHLKNVDISLSQSALLLGKIRPQEIFIENFLSDAIFNQEFFKSFTDLNNDNNYFLGKTLKEIHDDISNVPILSSLKKIYVNRSNIELSYKTKNYGEFIIKDTHFSYNDYWRKSHLQILGTFKASHARIENSPFKLEGIYQKNHSSLKFLARLGEKAHLSHFKYQNNQGQYHATANGTIDNNLKFSRLSNHLVVKNLVLKSLTQSDISIKDADVQTYYNPSNKSLNVNIEKFNSNWGQLGGKASLLETGNFKIHLNARNFMTSDSSNHTIDKAEFKLNGNYKENTQQKTVQLNLPFIHAKFSDKMTIQGNARFDYDKKPYYESKLRISRITLSQLKSVWPPFLAGGAKSWISENITEATFGDADISIISQPHTENPKIFLNMPIKHATFFYLRPMSPAKNVNGMINIDNQKLNINVTSGKIDSLKVHQASFFIPDIFAKIPIGKAKSKISGSIKPLLTIIDQKPLELMRKNKFDYSDSKGEFDGTIELALPLLKKVKLEEITLKSQTFIKQASIVVGKYKLPIEKVNATLNFTEKNAFGSGNLNLFDIFSTFNWKENFNLKAPVTTDLNLQFSATSQKIENILKRFKIKSSQLKNYFKGLLDAKTHIQLNKAGVKLLDLNTDLTQIALGDEQSFWSLPINSNKTLSLKAHQKNNDFFIDKVTLESSNSFVDLSNMIISQQRISSGTINHISFKETLKGGFGHYHFDNLKNKHMLQLRSSLFSIKEYVDFDKDRQTKQTLSKHPQEYPNMLATFHTHQLVIDDKTQLKNASFVVARHNQDTQKLRINVASPDISEAQLDIQSLPFQSQSIKMTCNDAGKFLQGFAFFKDYEGGKLVGQLTKTPSLISGNMRVDGGALKNAPWTAKLFSFASLTGIVDRLQSNALSINEFTFDFNKDEKTIEIKNGRVNGSGLGISFQGFYHLDTEKIDFFGTAVPIYGVNSLFSDIPLIGTVLSSRKGEGMIGLSYKISGETKNPDVFVNPLSLLTPGITRRIFE